MKKHISILFSNPNIQQQLFWSREFSFKIQDNWNEETEKIKNSFCVHPIS